MGSDTTLAIKGLISELPEANRQRVIECHAKLAALVQEYEGAGTLAIALLGSELQDET